VAFSELEHLMLSEYPVIEDLWCGQLHLNVLCNLKSLVVRYTFGSYVLFSSNTLQVLVRLEELTVQDCYSLETVFDVQDIQSKEKLVKQIAELKKLTLSRLPQLKHIWNEDPHEIINFGKLEIVDVSECQSLLNIFSLSLSKNLGHLEKLRIESCGVEGIVAMEEGPMKISFSFPRMNELELVDLTNLKSFYPGKHTLECPSLKILKVFQCEALRMFSFNYSSFREPGQVDKIYDMPFQQALFSTEKVKPPVLILVFVLFIIVEVKLKITVSSFVQSSTYFVFEYFIFQVCPNLKDLALYGKDAVEILNGCYQENLFQKVEILHLQCFEETPITFLNGFLPMCPNLATLEVRSSSFETLFLTGEVDHLHSRSPKQIRDLRLLELEQLKFIWQEDFPGDHFVLQDLESLRIVNCPNLITLIPSSLSLKNLTTLKVDNCKGLIHLITTETAKCLVQLTKLVIRNCEKMLDVVEVDQEKAEEEIIFENLEILKFSSLLSLRSFCNGKQAFIFPSLLRFVVEGCAQMKNFSSGFTIAPFLTAIEVENKKKRWKDDLNTTIEQLSIEKVRKIFGSYSIYSAINVMIFFYLSLIKLPRETAYNNVWKS